jgi:hypothetical protein
MVEYVTSSNTSNKNTDLEDYNLESTLVSSKIVKASTKQNNVISFILDSGATIHTYYIKELFNSIQSTTTAIKWGNTNNTIKASGIGNIDVIFTSTQKIVTNVFPKRAPHLSERRTRPTKTTTRRRYATPQ